MSKLQPTNIHLVGARPAETRAPTLRRDKAVDLLRGLAIAFMVMANMSEILKEPHPYWYRLSGSFVAPLFILLAGMMVQYTARFRAEGFGHYFRRGAMLLGFAVFNDVVNFHIWPLFTCDVLYLIAFSLPLCYLLGRGPAWLRIAAILAIFAATPYLQQVLGYTDYPTEIYFTSEESVAATRPTGILNHWLVDGWFPIFPWLAFSFLGVQFAEWRWRYRDRPHFRGWSSVAGAALSIAGAFLWQAHPGAQMIRDVYGELYYPPTVGFLVTAVGVLILLFVFAEVVAEWPVWKPVEVLGSSSLALYLLHLSIITYVLAPRWPSQELGIYLAIYSSTMACLTAVAYGLRALRGRWKRMPEAVKMIVGG